MPCRRPSAAGAKSISRTPARAFARRLARHRRAEARESLDPRRNRLGAARVIPRALLGPEPTRRCGARAPADRGLLNTVVRQMRSTSRAAPPPRAAAGELTTERSRACSACRARASAAIAGPGYESIGPNRHFIHSPFYVYAYARATACEFSLRRLERRRPVSPTAISPCRPPAAQPYAELLAPSASRARSRLWGSALSLIDR